MNTRTWDDNRTVINQLWPTYTFTDEERRLWHDDLSGKDQAVLYDAIRNAKRSHETPWPQVKWIHDAYRELDIARRAVTRQQRPKEPKLDLRIVDSEDRRLADEFIAMIDLASPSDFEQIEHHVLDKLPKMHAATAIRLLFYARKRLLGQEVRFSRIDQAGNESPISLGGVK